MFRVSVFALAIVSAGLAIAQPMNMRNHRATSLPFLRLNPLTRLLPAGGTEWSFNWSESNDHSDQINGAKRIEEDGEFTRIGLGYRKAVRSGLEWGVDLTYVSFSGGFLDPVIEALHNSIIRWNDPLRENSPQNQSRIALQGKEFGSFDGLAGPVLWGATMLPGGYLGQLAIKVPTGGQGGLVDSGGLDVGLGIGRKWALDRAWDLDVHAGVIRQGKSDVLDDTRTWVQQATFAVSWNQSTKDTWLVQWWSESSGLRSGIPTSDAVHRSSGLGYRRQIDGKRSIEAFISEDYDPLNKLDPSEKHIGPDVVIGISFRVRI